ncbi:hypothetical protein SAY86_010332 [Trapa natans]|uniref:Uncharacterized protein n=1 Tax=Trapa natans TaxID=22666 RepID=A0AAN7QR15_TRANT|nr:hypothetical protein SAY86_010332 [Trapa natans]
MRRGCLSSLLKGSNLSYLRDALCGHAYVTNAAYSSIGHKLSSTGSIMGRVFADYSVYKGKASLSLSPVLPTFTRMEYGLRVDRQGKMMLRFCPAVGDRKYDWEKKQLFALSATELGSIISLGPKDSCEFFHDPSMKSSNAGQVRKSLTISPTQDGNGYFVSLSVVNNLLRTNERLTVPLTTAEFAVIKTACSFALPHIIGWDQCTSHQSTTNGEKSWKVGSLDSDSEWNR